MNVVEKMTTKSNYLQDFHMTEAGNWCSGKSQSNDCLLMKMKKDIKYG